jgi:hypothetical protein
MRGIGSTSKVATETAKRGLRHPDLRGDGELAQVSREVQARQVATLFALSPPTARTIVHLANGADRE